MPERCGSHWRVNINRIPDKETLFARKFKLDKTCTDLNYSDNLQVIGEINDKKI